MAWLCSGESNAELVERMVQTGLLSDDRIAEAFRAVDRAVVPLLIDAPCNRGKSQL